MDNENINLLVVFLIGIALLVFGNFKRTQRTRLIASGIRTEATVLRIESSFTGADQTPSYYPVVSYNNSQNETFVKTYGVSVNYNTYKPGDSVNIIYDSTDNNEFIIDDKRSKAIGPVFMVVSLAVIIFALVQYFFHPFTQVGSS